MFYQKALDYTMSAVLQRNGTCDVVNADRIGNYFGHFIYDNKNFAFELLSKGLAVVSENENNPNPYYHEMLKYEAAAQEKKVGIWQYDNLGNILKYGEGSSLSFDYEEVHKDMTSFRINEYIDFHNFYINVLPNNTLNTIEKVLSEYDNTPSKCVKLELPIKMGTLCACKYSEDNKYYRAIVKAVTKDKKYEVEFIDYGNVEVAPIDSLIKLDGSVTTYEPQALLCEMAYLKYSKNSMRKALEKFENFADFDKVVKGKMCYKYNEDGKAKCGVVVYLKGDNVDASYHSEFLRLGYAKMDRTKKVPTYLKALDDVERKAKEKGMGLWHENERCDYGIDEEEEEYGY
jgi:staphylococcal nuclease domain-containing protein 1